jgi:hypothetical protein
MSTRPLMYRGMLISREDGGVPMFGPDDPGAGPAGGDGGVGVPDPCFWAHDGQAIASVSKLAIPYRTSDLFMIHPDRKENFHIQHTPPRKRKILVSRPDLSTGLSDQHAHHVRQVPEVPGTLPVRLGRYAPGAEALLAIKRL